MDIQEKLQQAGLTGNESKVYLELVKKGELTANQLAKNLSLDRTLSYTVLNHLIEKGQVSYIIKGKKKFFAATEPHSLLNSIKSKEVLVKDLITEITKIKKEPQQETEIKILEGKEGVRTLFQIFIKEKSKSFVSFGATGRAYDLLYEAPVIAKEFIKQKISGKIILGKRHKEHEFTQFKNFEIRTLDINSEASTTIFKDYVSIHMIKEKPIVILIKNKDIANSYRNYFDWMWKKVK